MARRRAARGRLKLITRGLAAADAADVEREILGATGFGGHARNRAYAIDDRAGRQVQPHYCATSPDRT